MLVFGRQDPHVPAEGRQAIHDALSAAKVSFTWHELNAVHAFVRDDLGVGVAREADALRFEPAP